MFYYNNKCMFYRVGQIQITTLIFNRFFSSYDQSLRECNACFVSFFFLNPLHYPTHLFVSFLWMIIQMYNMYTKCLDCWLISMILLLFWIKYIMFAFCVYVYICVYGCVNNSSYVCIFVCVSVSEWVSVGRRMALRIHEWRVKRVGSSFYYHFSLNHSCCVCAFSFTFILILSLCLSLCID